MSGRKRTIFAVKLKDGRYLGPEGPVAFPNITFSHSKTMVRRVLQSCTENFRARNLPKIVPLTLIEHPE